MLFRDFSCCFFHKNSKSTVYSCIRGGFFNVNKYSQNESLRKKKLGVLLIKVIHIYSIKFSSEGDKNYILKI